MALTNGYAVLKGHAIAGIPAHSSKDHYSIHVVDDDTHYRLAVNIRSVAQGFGPDLFFHLDHDFKHPLTEEIHKLPLGRKLFAPGASSNERRDSGVALDFIRMNLFDRTKMKLFPGIVPGANNDLNEQIDALVKDMVSEEESIVYAFGEPWINEQKNDKFFGFFPGNGVHNLHMNQGDLTGKFSHEDGTYQDGGLIFYYPSTNKYVAFFTKFQSQSWHTNDKNGHAIKGNGDDIPTDNGGHPPVTGSGNGHNTGGGNPIGEGHDPDGTVQIVGALVNPVGPAPESETVTLLNSSDKTVSLKGWHLADKDKDKTALSGSLAPGETVRIAVVPPMKLSNSGGIITLLDDHGVKIDGVSYTANQAHVEGVTLTFRK